MRAAASAHKAVFTFLGRCIAYWVAALLLVSRVPAVENAGIWITVHTVQLVLGVFGIPLHRIGAALFVGGARIEIVSDCSPHMPYLIYAAVVLAFPARWRDRLIGLAVGAVVIHVFNTIRIFALIGILSWRRDWFEFAHIYLWQTGTVVAVFATFALWLKSTGPRVRPGPRPA